jgi:hypothetical protein
MGYIHYVFVHMYYANLRVSHMHTHVCLMFIHMCVACVLHMHAYSSRMCVTHAPVAHYVSHICAECAHICVSYMHTYVHMHTITCGIMCLLHMHVYLCVHMLSYKPVCTCMGLCMYLCMLLYAFPGKQNVLHMCASTHALMRTCMYSFACACIHAQIFTYEL